MDPGEGNLQPKHALDSAEESAHVNFLLRERVKELTVLHQTACLLQDDLRPAREVLTEVVNLLPAAWQYPEITAARIRFQELEVFTSGF